MSVLTDSDRAAVYAELMQDLSREREPCALTKADLRAAVDAADSWANANAASFNSALPAAARTTLTAAQKARLLAAVILRRFTTGV
jgi:hypothetical protein